MVIRTNILYQCWNTFPGSGFINIKIIGWNEFFNTTYITINNLIITTFNKLFRFGLYLVDHLIHADYFPGVYDPFCCRIFWHNFYNHILLCKNKFLWKRLLLIYWRTSLRAILESQIYCMSMQMESAIFNKVFWVCSTDWWFLSC